MGPDLEECSASIETLYIQHIVLRQKDRNLESSTLKTDILLIDTHESIIAKSSSNFIL